MKKNENSKLKKGGISREKRDREFLYHQLAGIIRQDIETGKFKPGDRLPSMDDLSEEHSVNKVTVRRALAELNAAGLIYSVPAQGTYVAEPAAAARLAPRNRTMTVGLVSQLMVPGNTGLYHLEIITGIREELSKHNANLVIPTARPVDSQIKSLDHVAATGLDAIIYLGVFEPQALRRMVENGPPAVLVDYSIRGLQIDSILLDNRGGGCQAMEHLLSLGHRKLAVIVGAEDQTATKERMEGALDALDQAGVPRSILRKYVGNFQRESGYQAMAEILKSGDIPTGVFCFNDEMAAGALQALYSFSSLQVPRDISIVGFDDTSWATATQPPLTTIAVAKSLMGRIAVQRIMARIKHADQSTVTILPTDIVVRNSTAPAPCTMFNANEPAAGTVQAGI